MVLLLLNQLLVFRIKRKALVLDLTPPAVYTCKVLNFRFISVTLITLLDTVEATPFFSQFSGKLHVIRCKLPVHTCKLPVYSKVAVS